MGLSPDAIAHDAVLRRGSHMPIIGFGTWQIKGRLARESVLCALQTGYRHIDTATVYDNEREVGRSLIESGLAREQLFVTTKLPGDAKSVRRTIETSLSDLRIDYVDLWLVHWPPSRAASRSLYQEMLVVRDEGLARSIGVSNYSLGEIDDLVASTGETPEVNQVPWSPFLHRGSEQHDLDQRQIVLEGYSPFKESRLDDAVVGEIAATNGVSPAQVVLRWHIQHGIVVIPKSVHPDRIAENFDIFGFSLDAESMQRLDGLSVR